MLKSSFKVSTKVKSWYNGYAAHYSDSNGLLLAANGANVSICDTAAGLYYEMDNLDAADVSNINLDVDEDDSIAALYYIPCSAESDVEREEDIAVNTSSANPLNHHNGIVVVSYRSCWTRLFSLRTQKTICKWKSHEAPVLCMDVKIVGTHVILCTGSADATVKCWDISKAVSSPQVQSMPFCTHQFKGHRGLVTAVKFIPSLSNDMDTDSIDDYAQSDWVVATADEYGNVRVWDLAAVLKCDTGVNQRVHRGDGSSEAFMGGDQLQQSLSKGQKSKQKNKSKSKKKGNDAQCLVAHIDGLHSSIIRTLAWSPCGQWLLTGSRDQTVSLLKFNADDELDRSAVNGSNSQLEHVHSFAVMDSVECGGLFRMGNGQLYMYIAGSKNEVAIWSMDSFEKVHSYSLIAGGTDQDGDTMINNVFFDQLNQHFIVTNTLLNVYQLKLDYVRKRSTLALSLQSRWIGAWDEIVDLALLPRQIRSDGNEGHQMLVACGSSNDLVLLNVKSQDLNSKEDVEEDDSQRSLNTQQQQKLMAMGKVKMLQGHRKPILCIDQQQVGDYTLFATGSKDNVALVWLIDHSTGKYRLCGKCVGHAGAIVSVSLSTCLSIDQSQKSIKGFLLTASDDRTVKRWNFSIGIDSSNYGAPQQLSSLYTVKTHDKDVNCVRICPLNDGKVFATGSQDKTIKIWNSELGTSLATLKGHRRGVWNITFQSHQVNGELLMASACGDKTVRIWSMRDYSCLRTLEGHSGSVLKLNFLSNGQQLLSSGSDGLSKLWNVKTGDCALTLDEHQDKIWANSVLGEDEQRGKKCIIALGSSDASISLLIDQTAEQLEAEHAKAEQLLVEEQALSNHLHNQDWLKAFRLAFNMDKNVKCAQVLRSLIAQNGDSYKKLLSEIVQSLDTDQDVVKMLTFIRDWNTNIHYVQVAQAVLCSILDMKSVESVCKLPGIRNLLAALIPYTEKHFTRIDSMITDVYCVDYLLRDFIIEDGTQLNR
ncbi:hypothetical protein MP228_007908 [Amoeboaphelidium protococcarum]|nr:hypothetical protein MP228_007908 [Amoeboaphelidium protococcarum]